MVHALILTRGLLRPHGAVADLRNDRFASIHARDPQVYCLTGDRRLHAGRIKIIKPLADFRAADRAIHEVVRRRLFRLGAVDVFEVRHYFDTPAHLDMAVARYWAPFATLEDSTRRRLGALMHRHPGAKITAISRLRLNVLLRT
jgi:hypothetical protein